MIHDQSAQIEIGIHLTGLMDYLVRESKEQGDDYKHVDTLDTIAALREKLASGVLVVMNTRPRCMVVDDDQQQCEGDGIYQPHLILHDANGTPVSQVATQPPLRVCEAHATNNVGDYVPRELLSQLQAQAMQQGVLVMIDKTAMQFLNHTTGQFEPPPTVSIAKPGQ